VTKLNPAGSGLVYSTYLGGSGNDNGGHIAVDAAGNAYVTGSTISTDFPTTPGAFQTSLQGNFDTVVTKLNPAGSGLVYSTYLGGSGGGEGGGGIAVDAAGNVYVTGSTLSTDFPTTPGAFQTSLQGNSDTVVTKLNPAGSGLVYSTYLGGSGDENGGGIAVDAAGNAYVTGSTGSTDFPTTPGAFQSAFQGGGSDAVVTKLNPAGSGLVYSTYLGGSGGDEGGDIAVDAAGNAYVTGGSGSTDFPTTPGAFQPTFGGGSMDSFVTKIEVPSADLALAKADTPDPVLAGQNLTYTITVGNNGPLPATGVTVTDTMPGGVTFVSASASQGSCTGTSTVTCTLGNLATGASATVTVTVRPTAAGPLSNTASVQGNEPDPDTANNTDTETTTVTPAADLAITKSDSPDPVKVRSTLTFALTATNNGPSPATGVVVTDTLPSGVTFQSAVASQGSCSGTGTVTCNLGALAVGARATVTITVTPPATGTLTNTARIQGNETDPTSANNTATVNTAVTVSGQPFHLTVAVQGQGKVTSNPPGIDCGTSPVAAMCDAVYGNEVMVQLTATPATGWTFDHWERACTGTTSPCTVTMTTDRAVKAVFSQVR
jgi:uncharacterized repeat protein (TIGR01451 family)